MLLFKLPFLKPNPGVVIFETDIHGRGGRGRSQASSRGGDKKTEKGAPQDEIIKAMAKLCLSNAQVVANSLMKHKNEPAMKVVRFCKPAATQLVDAMMDLRSATNILPEVRKCIYLILTATAWLSNSNSSLRSSPPLPIA